MRITSVHNPRVADVCALRQHRARRETGLFLAEGVREVSRAAVAGLRFVETWRCSELLRGGGEGEGSLPRDPGVVYDAAPAVFRKMAYRDDPEGVLAVVEQPRWALGEGGIVREAHAFNAWASSGVAPLYLVGVGLEKPGNLGAMARTAAAAGVAGLLVVDAVVDAFNPNAIRASTGAVFALPVVGCTSDEALRWLRLQGAVVLAAVLDGSVPHDAADYGRGRAAAIVIGAEDTGLGEPWLSGADQRVRIAMSPRAADVVDSLNAAAAAAVLLFEAVRRRA